MSVTSLNQIEELKSRLEALERKLDGSNKSNNQSANNTEITFSIKDSFEKLSYWTNFIGTILYIVFALGCFAIMYLFLAEVEYFEPVMVFGWLIGLAVLFCSAKFLCDFSSNTSKSLRGGDSQYRQKNLEDGLVNLTSFFRLHGIIIIFYLCILAASVILYLKFV